ncbi:MAG: NAD(P)-dependent oxidoreductase [Elusimicrobia bacterium]|nr:NAD(P)-dependent oxidoreductase [Elusimicrobiota bacterium]
MVPHRIGFVGLGIMGKAMAANLIKAGYNVFVYNRTREKTREFENSGCTAVAMPKDLAGIADIVITMVTDEKAMDEALEGPTGLFAGNFGRRHSLRHLGPQCGCSEGQTLINMSTLPVSYTKNLAEKCLKSRIYFLDCPVTGSKPLAESGQLIILAGGDENLVERMKPVLLTMGKAIVYAGPAPNGTGLKLCMNLLVAQMTSGLCESAVLAKILEINPALIFEVLKESPALNCGYFKLKQDNVLNERFSPAFSLKNMLKDVRYMLKEAETGKQSLPVLETLEKLMAKSYNTGEGGQDLTVILKTLKDYYKN